MTKNQLFAVKPQAFIGVCFKLYSLFVSCIAECVVSG